MKKVLSCILSITLFVFPLSTIAESSTTTASTTLSTTTANGTVPASTATSSTTPAGIPIYTSLANPNAFPMSTSTILALAQKIPDGFRFQNDLGYGLYSSEVYVLQLLLNTDSRTVIATTGYGSRGYESNFFGLLTKNAVNRFQQIYASEILTPAGLSSPTGVIGSRSRIVLNRLVANIESLASTISTTNYNNIAAAQLNAYTNNMIFGNQSASVSSTSSSGSNTTGLIVAGAVVVGAVAISAASNAAANAIKTSFGGYLVYTQYCTCMASALLYIYDKSLNTVIQLMYIPGASSLKQNYNIFSSGVNVLGGYTPIPIQCMVYVGTSCIAQGTSIGTIDFIRGIGTSAF